jgi:Ca-activated chloride channel homolog
MKRLIMISVLAVSTATLWAQQERRFIRKGTEEFNNQKFVESEVEYRKALDKDAQSYEAKYNMAGALFKQQKLNEALEQYQALAGTQTDKSRLSQIYHNMGNVYFSGGKFDESIDAYKKALKNNPLDNETRYNLIAAQKMKQKNDQQQNQDQQQDKQEEQQQEKEQQQQKQNQQQQEQDQMKRQDAERLLNAMQQDEDDLQKEKRKIKATQKATIDKNW